MSVTQTTRLQNLDANAVITQYSRKLRRKAIARDIYCNIRGDDVIYKNKQMSIPDMAWHKVEADALAGANNTRIVYKLPVNANILRGRTTALGTEVPPEIRTGIVYRNNYRIVFQAEPGYGEDKLDAEPYQLYQEHVEDLYPHAAAEEGLEIRMAYLETFGWNLMAGSTQNVCQAQWNPNFYVLGCPSASQPTFHPNFNTYTQRILNAIVASSNNNFVQRTSQMLTGNALDNIARWAFRRRLMPMTLEGRSAYVLTISQLAAQRFSDPSFVDSMGNRWTQAGQITNKQIQNWYGIIGKYQGPNCTFYLVVDDRLPTLYPTGTAAPFGLTAGYNWPTDNDLRNIDQTTVRDAMILHGKGGVVKWEPEKMHLIDQDWDYRLKNGKGYAGVRGFQLLQFDAANPDPTGLTREHWGSAIIVGGRAEP